MSTVVEPEVTYASYLRVAGLLELQNGATSTDELLFIVVHQSHELWFRLALAELTHVRDELFDAAVPSAVRRLKRVTQVLRLLVAHWDVLSTLTPAGYLSFRDALGGGSGFQSAQFREIEFLCGLKDARYLARMTLTQAERAALQRRLDERSVADAFGALRSRLGEPSLVAVLSTDEHPELALISEALMDLDEALAVWRARHVVLVERQIGTKLGTGGSEGVDYLRATQTKRLFPQLWAARTLL